MCGSSDLTRQLPVYQTGTVSLDLSQIFFCPNRFTILQSGYRRLSTAHLALIRSVIVVGIHSIV